MSNVLYRWPSTAAVGRAVPKTRFYEHGNVRAALREKFVDEVKKVTWAYKLSESTIRLKGTDAVPEIQVFAVEAKGGDVADDVLAAIDRSVHFPIIFEISKGEEIRTAAAQKTLGSSAPKIGPYFTTSWLPIAADRRPLPAALDLPVLYEALLSSLLPLATLCVETVSATTERIDQARKLEREISALERKLRNEPQLNRKIELRKALKEHQAALEALA